MAAIFSYGFDIAKKNFEEKGCEFFTLGDYDSLITEASKTGFISDDEISQLRDWRINPETWGK